MWIARLEGASVSYRDIVNALADAIGRGEVRPGDKLPPQRELAWKLGVNLTTVSRAYQEATRRRLVGGEVGRGTFVLADSDEAKLFALKQARGDLIDLSTNIPARPSKGVTFAEAAGGLSAEERRAADEYHSPDLLERTRRAAATWLEWRGLADPPETIIPCSGAQAGLAAVLMAFTKPGDAVLVEAHTFPGMKAAARQLGLKLVGVDCDAEGVRPDALAAATCSSGARLAVLVPNLQNPTGTVMGEGRRREIADAVAGLNLRVVEDDAYGPLAELPPLSLLLGEHGILISTFSKSVLPGLRFGLISGSSVHLAPLVEDVHTTTWLTTPLALAVACRWIMDGTAMRRARWQRAEVAARWNILIREFGESDRAPAPHAWLSVPDRPEDAVARCRNLGVEVVPASLFSVSRTPAQRIRVCLTAAASRDQLGVALARLREAGVTL